MVNYTSSESKRTLLFRAFKKLEESLNKDETITTQQIVDKAVEETGQDEKVCRMYFYSYLSDIKGLVPIRRGIYKRADVNLLFETVNRIHMYEDRMKVIRESIESVIASWSVKGKLNPFILSNFSQEVCNIIRTKDDKYVIGATVTVSSTIRSDVRFERVARGVYRYTNKG